MNPSDFNPQDWTKRQEQWLAFNRWEETHRPVKTESEIIHWAGEAREFYLRFNPNSIPHIVSPKDYSGIRSMRQSLQKAFSKN